MKSIVSSLFLLFTLGVFVSSCDKIEDTERDVVVEVLHPTQFEYHIGIGLNQAGNQADWDTTGNVTIAFKAQVGDAIYYSMNSQAPMSGLNLTVDGVDNLNLNIEGVAPNGTAGFLIVD